jgi:hypothetical protein
MKGFADMPVKLRIMTADMIYAGVKDAWLRVRNMSMVCDDETYRIAITKKGMVEVMCFGVSSIDRKLEPKYNAVDDLPNWVKERLAVLSIVDPTPPIPEVQGIGRRISPYVFWVYSPEASTSV